MHGHFLESATILSKRKHVAKTELQQAQYLQRIKTCDVQENTRMYHCYLVVVKGSAQLQAKSLSRRTVHCEGHYYSGTVVYP